MKVFLLIYLLIAGEWVSGVDIDGWHPREQPSVEVCEQRAEVAMETPPPKGADDIRAVCLEVN